METQRQWVERLTELWQIQYWCHLSFFSRNCDTASQRTTGDEVFSVGGNHTTAAVNQVLSEGLCRLSALQTVKGKKKDVWKSKMIWHRSHKRSGWEAEKEVKHPACGLAPQPNSASRRPLSKSGHATNTHKKTTHPELSALRRIKVPLLHKLSVFNRTILVPLFYPCASLQHTGTTKGDCYWWFLW